MKRLEYVNKDLEEFIKKTSIELSLPEDLIEKVVKDQWKHANIAARSLKEIEIKEIGTFYTSAKKMFTKISRFRRILAKTKDKVMIEDINSKISEMEKTKNYGRTKERLEEQASNTGGDNEQYFSY